MLIKALRDLDLQAMLCLMKKESGRNRYPIPKEMDSKIRTASCLVILSPDSMYSTSIIIVKQSHLQLGTMKVTLSTVKLLMS